MLRKPITAWLQRPDIDANKGMTDENGKALPPRIVPDIGELVQYIAGLNRVHGDLWAVQFAWPMTPKIQRKIAALLEKYKAFNDRRLVPLTEVDVAETVPDLKAVAIDGIQTTREVLVKRTLRALSYRSSFVGE